MTQTSERPAAPVRMTILGGADLRKGEEELTRVLAQPRRFALLVYLALAAPTGFLRRDRLLGVFWPDLDMSHARASLRQALRHLRRWLGAGVLLGRGDEEVGLDASRFSSDVADFRARLDQANDEGAVALYGGPLLPGFQITGAPDFERWLAGERRRLQMAQVDAAVRLMASAEEAGELARATELARRAVAADPLNETVARRHMSLLDRMGNRGAAVAAYDALVARLQERLDLAPAPETQALVARIRGRTSSEHGDPGGIRPPGARVERRRVAVLPFRNRTGSRDLDVLGGIAADWIAQGLADIPEAVVAPPLFSHLPAPTPELQSEAGLDPDRIAAAVGHSGAGTVVEGAFYLDEDRIRIHTRIIDGVAGRLVRGPEDVVVPRERAMDGLKQVSREVVTALAPTLSSRAIHVREGARPPSFQAYRSYMEGLEAFIGGRWDPALAHFRRAAAAEPDYALPRIVQAIAHWNLGQLQSAEEVAREAAGLRDRLGRFEGAVLDMVRAWLAGDWLGAHEASRVQAGIAPGSIPHFQVAEEARRLNRPGEAQAVLARLDPEAGELEGWIFYWVELATAQHLRGEHGLELKAAHQARTLHPDDPMAALLELRALAALGEVGRISSLIDQVGTLPGDRKPDMGNLLLEVALELQAHGSSSAAEELFGRTIAWYQERVDGASPAFLRRDLARALYHAGHLEEAEEHFRALAGSDPPRVVPVGPHHGHLQAHLDEGYLAVLASRRGDVEEVEARSRELRNATGPFLYGAQWFWLAAVDAVLGESDRAVSRLRRAFAEGLPHEMFLHTDPHLARLKGHPRFEGIMRPRG